MQISTVTHGHGRARDAASLPGRAALAATMLYHGADKLKPARREQAAQMFSSLGLRPARFWSLATALAEVGAGALTLAGILTRPAALAVIVTQAVAVAKVHAPKGFSITKGGYEFNLALMGLAGAMLVAGPGRYSLHGALRRAVLRRPRLLKRVIARRRLRRAAQLIDALF